MKNVRLWLQAFIRPRKRTRAERERIAARAREEAFGEITERTRAEDRQRLADAVKGKGSLI